MRRIKNFPWASFTKATQYLARIPAWKKYQAAMLATNRSAGVALSRQSEEINHMWMQKQTNKLISRGFETPDRCHKKVQNMVIRINRTNIIQFFWKNVPKNIQLSGRSWTTSTSHEYSRSSLRKASYSPKSTREIPMCFGSISWLRNGHLRDCLTFGYSFECLRTQH